MDSLEGKLRRQTEFGIGLWRAVRRECGAKGLASHVALLARAHRQLLRSDAALPPTTSTGRQRRRCLEALQSQTRALEDQVRKVSATADELEAALRRRLDAIEALCREAPTGTEVEWEGPAHPLITVVILIAAGCLWPREGLGVSACCIMVIAALTRVSTWIEFDGRSLRIRQRSFGLRWTSSSVDLAQFNQLALTDSVGHTGAGRVVLARLTLKSSDREVQVGSGARDDPALNRLARQVREWCTIAARERGISRG